MKILFIHQNFPGQFTHLAANLAGDSNNTVVALSMSRHQAPPGVLVRHYTLLRQSSSETHVLLKEQETHIMRAEACAAAMLQLKREGFYPDLIIAHPGWGEALFSKDVFPQAKLVIYCEFYYAAEGRDVGFDPEQQPINFVQRCKLRLKNTTNLLSLEIADAGISPTQWQKNTFPLWAQDKIIVIHEGVDLERLNFNPLARLKLSTKKNQRIDFSAGDEVLSYVARNLEPVRGFHIFMRTLPEILRRRPAAHIVIIGGDEVSYGTPPPTGSSSWKEHMLHELGSELDYDRIHFLGQVPYEHYLTLLSISRVHAYWTIPFVLSWSFIEAAVSGLPVVASNTPPVQEFADQLQVTTADFFSHDVFSEMLIEKLATPNRHLFDSRIKSFGIQHCVAEQRKWLDSIL